MRILVVTKISIPAINCTIPEWYSLVSEGCQYALNQAPWVPDVIISMGVGVMEETFKVIEMYPTAKLFCYNWDCYSWVWTRPRPGEYDYNRYGELLKKAVEIWVPSTCTGIQTTQWWGLENWETILSSVPWWEHDNIRDDGYALCTLRAIPDDWCGKFEEACNQLHIPYKLPNHELSYEEYKNVVASCRFLVSAYKEASTGGLTLLEGYYHGKPCLLTDSKWNGARQYFGNRATYFCHSDFGDFRNKLQQMFESPPAVPADHKQWVRDHYHSSQMVEDIVGRLHAHGLS